MSSWLPIILRLPHLPPPFLKSSSSIRSHTQQPKIAMKLMHFFGSSSSKKENHMRKRSNGKSCSFGSTASSSSTSVDSVTTPRTVLPSSASASGAKKPVAVTREELEVALRRVVSSEEELAEMLAEAEAGLMLEEIAAAGADEGELKETFAVFDANGDGKISAEELRAVLASLGDERCSVEDCRRMIGGVDTDGDGFVCFDEFTRMMNMSASTSSRA